MWGGRTAGGPVGGRAIRPNGHGASTIPCGARTSTELASRNPVGRAWPGPHRSRTASAVRSPCRSCGGRSDCRPHVPRWRARRGSRRLARQRAGSLSGRTGTTARRSRGGGASASASSMGNRSARAFCGSASLSGASVGRVQRCPQSLGMGARLDERRGLRGRESSRHVHEFEPKTTPSTVAWRRGRFAGGRRRRRGAGVAAVCPPPLSHRRTGVSPRIFSCWCRGAH